MKAITNAQKKLVEDNMGIVFWHVESLIRQHARYERYRDDLKQEGFLALMRAATTFDPSRGFKLTTYAGYYIRQAFSRYTLRHRTPFGKLYEVVEGRVEVARLPSQVTDFAFESVSAPEIDLNEKLDSQTIAESTLSELTERQVAAYRGNQDETRVRALALRSAKAFLASEFGIQPMKEVAAEYGIHRNGIPRLGAKAAAHFPKFVKAIRQEAA